MVEIAKDSPVVDDTAIAALLDGPTQASKLNRIIENSNDDLELSRSIEARAKLVAQHLLSVRNFVAALTQATQKEVVEYAREALPKMRKGSLDGIEEGSKGIVKAAFVALAFQLGGVVAAMAVGITSFAPLARKNAEIRDVAQSDNNE